MHYIYSWRFCLRLLKKDSREFFHLGIPGLVCAKVKIDAGFCSCLAIPGFILLFSPIIKLEKPCFILRACAVETNP